MHHSPVIAAAARAGCACTRCPTNHVLERDDSVGPFTDRLPLEGQYTSAADAGTFLECVAGLRFRVRDDARGRDLRRRHRAVSPAERAALVSIEAHLLPAESRGASLESLAVDRFISIKPAGECPAARAE